jgi:hypothetical protein
MRLRVYLIGRLTFELSRLISASSSGTFSSRWLTRQEAFANDRRSVRNQFANLARIVLAMGGEDP